MTPEHLAEIRARAEKHLAGEAGLWPANWHPSHDTLVLLDEVGRLRAGIESALALAANRERFVLMGPRGMAQVEQALRALLAEIEGGDDER